MSKAQFSLADYNQALKIQRIEKEVIQRTVFKVAGGFKKQAQLRNAIERWILNREQIDGKTSPIADNEFIRELKERKDDVAQPEYVLSQLQTIMKKSDEDESAFIELEYSIYHESNHVVVIIGTNGLIRRNIASPRYKRMLQFTSNNAIPIAAVVLKYAGIITGGQQWNIPTNVYRWMNKQYGVSAEGFASPFNSQMMMVAPNRTNPYFCSLFPSTDAVFGSCGDFFQCEFIGHDNVFVNPPYVNQLLERLIIRIIHLIATQPKKRIFMTVPAWTDANWWKQSVVLARHYWMFKGGEYFYEETKGGKVDIINTVFDTGIFAFIGAEAQFTPLDLPDYWRSITPVQQKK